MVTNKDKYLDMKVSMLVEYVLEIFRTYYFILIVNAIRRKDVKAARKSVKLMRWVMGINFVLMVGSGLLYGTLELPEFLERALIKESNSKELVYYLAACALLTGALCGALMSYIFFLRRATVIRDCLDKIDRLLQQNEYAR
jgi:Na+/pantothenate symporter